MPAPSDQSPADAVAEALRLYRQGVPRWPAPLVGALEQQDDGAALRWAIDCIAASLRPLRERDPESLSSPLQRLRSLASGGIADPDALMTMSEEVWYLPPERDEVQTAVARLYAALAWHRQGSAAGYRAGVADAIAVLSDSERFSAPLLDQFINLFSQSAPHHVG